MNVALIALPSEGLSVVPPLALAYIAGVLEQRRHIVRIYDLALTPDIPPNIAFRPLCAFRPRVVIVVGEQLVQIEQALDVLQDQCERVIPMRLSRDSLDICGVCTYVLAWFDRLHMPVHANTCVGFQGDESGKSNIYLERLPFPARHLLSLESYNLRAVGGELQTTLLLGMIDATESNKIILRPPQQIVAELRSVSRECGIRHYLFPGMILTTDLDWLHTLLNCIQEEQLGISWEASVDVEALHEALLVHMAQAGCEKLCFSLNATRVFDSKATRTQLKHIVALTRQIGIYAHADLELEPPYEAIPYLVDVAATFGLDDVSFTVRKAPIPDQSLQQQTTEDLHLEALARRRYHAGRSRQHMIERFGPALGMLIWKFRNWRLLSGENEGSDRVGLEEREDLAQSA